MLRWGLENCRFIQSLSLYIDGTDVCTAVVVHWWPLINTFFWGVLAQGRPWCGVRGALLVTINICPWSSSGVLTQLNWHSAKSGSGYMMIKTFLWSISGVATQDSLVTVNTCPWNIDECISMAVVKCCKPLMNTFPWSIIGVAAQLTVSTPGCPTPPFGASVVCQLNPVIRSIPGLCGDSLMTTDDWQLPELHLVRTFVVLVGGRGSRQSPSKCWPKLKCFVHTLRQTFHYFSTANTMYKAQCAIYIVCFQMFYN